MKKKTALLILVHYGRGGSTIYLKNFVRILILKGFNVIAICRKHDGSEILMQECGAHTLVMPLPLALNVTALDNLYSRSEKLLKFFKDCVKMIYGPIISLYLLCRFRPAILLVGDYPLIPVIIAGKILRKDVLTFVQCNITHDRWKKWFTRKIVHLSKIIICISPIHSNDFRTQSKSYDPQIVIIPNSIDSNLTLLSSFNSYYERLSIRTRNVVLYVGGIDSTKGVRTFLKVAQKVCAMKEDVSFILAGRFHKQFKTKYAIGTSNQEYLLSCEIIENVKKNDFNDRIKVIGETSYVRELLNISTFLLAPSIFSHFLRPIIEAWSVRKTAIVSNDEYGRYLTENETTGLIADKEDIDCWVLKTIRLLDDPEFSRQLGMRGYEKFIREYESEVINRKIRDILKTYHGNEPAITTSSVEDSHA